MLIVVLNLFLHYYYRFQENVVVGITRKLKYYNDGIKNNNNKTKQNHVEIITIKKKKKPAKI